jgi:hypothetical protein
MSPLLHHSNYTRNTQKNGAVLNVNENLISQPTGEQHTLSAAGNVYISLVLPAVRFSCLLCGGETSVQNGVAAGESVLCPPF